MRRTGDFFMARDEYNDDENDFGNHSRGSYGRDSHSGKTSSFNTSLLSDDGTFLGMKLSQDMVSKLTLFQATFLDWARRKAEHHGIPLAEKFSKEVLGHTALESKHFGGKVGNYLGYGVILSNQLLDVGRNIYDSANSLNELRLAVHPLSKIAGSKAAPLSGTNEVVVNARAKINGMFWQRLTQTATGAIATLPTLLIKINEQSAENIKRAEDLELERIKNDPKAMAKYWDKKLGFQGVAVDHESGMQAAKEMAIEGRQKHYLDKYAEFEKANKANVKKDIEKALKIDPDNVQNRLKTLENYGIETSNLRHAIRHNPNGLKDEIRRFNDGIKDEIKRITEENLKAKFVRQHGAFDGEWARYYNHGEDRNFSRNREHKATIREQMEQQFAKIEEEKARTEQAKTTLAKSHDPHDQTNMGNMAAGLGAGFVAELVTKAFGGKTLEKYKKPIALDRILHLRRTMETNEEPLAQVPPVTNSDDKDMGYVKYVHSIFQQHQKDCNRADIGDRFVERFDKEHWDDAAIQKLPDAELSPYEYAVKTIAKRIKDGRMDAIALVELVGDKNKKIVRDDGRSFGPRGAGKDDAAVKEAMLKIIDEKTALINAGQQQTEEQVNDKLGNFIFSVDDLKQALESKTLEAGERSFIFTVFSNVVGTDEKLCQKLGINNERCQELRKESKEAFNSLLDGSVSVLADMVESQPELMEKLKLTNKEKSLIRSLAERSKEEHKNVADLTENREEIKALETVVANATMTLAKEPATADESGKPKNFWQRVVAAAKDRKEAIKNAPKKAAEKDEPEKYTSPRARRDEDMDKSWAEEESTSPLTDKWAGDSEKKSFTGREQRRKASSLSPDAFDAGIAP